MPGLAHVLALSVVAAACTAPPSADNGGSSSRQGESSSEEEKRGQRLVFDWQPPCRVPAKERLEAGGDALEIAFVLRVGTSKEADSLELHFDDVKLLTANGKAVPEADAGLAAAGVQTPALLRGPRSCD